MPDDPWVGLSAIAGIVKLRNRAQEWNEMWEYRGQARPPYADPTGPGQESVWDYPRPPAVVRCGREVVVRRDGILIAKTRSAYRVLETASPPTFYLPVDDVDTGRLMRVRGRTSCEWKGEASYWALTSDPSGPAVAWSYPEPTAEFAKLKDYLSFYPALVECYVDGERVRPQPGGFYGGWITEEVVGPFKGEPGTGRW